MAGYFFLFAISKIQLLLFSESADFALQIVHFLYVFNKSHGPQKWMFAHYFDMVFQVADSLDGI